LDDGKIFRYHFLEEDDGGLSIWEGCVLWEGREVVAEVLESGFHSLISVGCLEIDIPCEELDWGW
jgi:hypothetical protein